MGDDMSAKERALESARRRIEYKHAREFMDEEPPTEEELRNEVRRIIKEEMTLEEKRELRADKLLEERMIKEEFEAREEMDEEV